MSAKKRRSTGAPACPEKKKHGLQLLKNPAARPRPEPDSELRAMVKDLNRRARAAHERLGREPEGKDAA